MYNIDSNRTPLHQNDNVSEEHSVFESTTGMNNTSSNVQNNNDNNEDVENETMTDVDNAATTDRDSTNDDNTPDNEEKDHPLNNFRSPPNETCLQSVIPDYPVTVRENDEVASGNEVFNIAPGENKHPV